MKVYILWANYNDIEEQTLLGIYINQEKAKRVAEKLKNEVTLANEMELYITEKELIE